jgi:hypothetical protein
VTVVDDDGKTWGLEAVSKISRTLCLLLSLYRLRLLLTTFQVEARGGETVAFKSPSLQEAIGMKYMFESMYGQPFELRNLHDLQTLARLADFYGALPVVSNALDGTLLRSPNLVVEIPNASLEFLTVSRTLRNKILYKESMIQVASQWKGQHNKLTDQPELRKQAIVAYFSLCDKLDTANQAILTIIAKTKTQSPASGAHLVVADRVQHHTGPWSLKNSNSLASYYRKLYEDKYEVTKAHDPHNYGSSYYAQWSGQAVTAVQTALGPVLENN